MSLEECKDLKLPSSIGMFNQLYFQMQNDIKSDKKLKTAFGQAPYMSENERNISFLNKYFVYKKVRQVDTEEVFKMELNKKIGDEPLDIEESIKTQKELEGELATKKDTSTKESVGEEKEKITITPKKSSKMKKTIEKK